MMLYHLDGRDKIDTPHWTEIYVIITVSTMLCEEIRKVKLIKQKKRLLFCFAISSSIMNMIHVRLNCGVQLNLRF